MNEYALPGLQTKSKDSVTVFANTMGLVSIICLFSALGAYIGKDLTGLWWILPWLLSIGCILGVYYASSKRKFSLAIVFLFAMGLLLGISVGTTINYYFETNPSAIYQATAATGLFVAGLGTFGYMIKKDLSFLYRFAFFALLGLIVFGIINIFLAIPNGLVIYSVFGLIVFGLYTILDFNRLKRAGEDEVVILAVAIFLDVFNIFLFFLSLFSRR